MSVVQDTRRRQQHGMIGEERPSPPKFAFAVSLYKSDGLFRALVDLTVVGLATLIFFFWVGAPGKQSSSATNPAPPATGSGIRNSDATPLMALSNGAPGTYSLDAARATKIEDKDLVGLAPAVADQIRIAREQLAKGDPQGARLALDKLDANTPAVIYAQVIVGLSQSGPNRGLEALRRLRAATSQGYAPAFTLTGNVLMQLVKLDELGLLPQGERVTLDGAGNAVPMTREQLAAEAVQWWERGAAFPDAAALRMLGMAEARGFTGRKNLTAAVSHWREAARLGDAAARVELGNLHLLGAGVEADAKKAAEYYRDAAEQGFAPAFLGLGVALGLTVQSGDTAAAQEAIAALEQAIRKSADPEAAGLAHEMLAVLFLDTGPAPLRNPPRSLAHAYAARALGSPRAAVLLARAYRTGVGVEVDKAVAYALLRQARRDPAVAAALAKLRPELTPDERARGEALAIPKLPLPGFALDELRAASLLSTYDGAAELFGSLVPASPSAPANRKLPRFEDVQQSLRRPMPASTSPGRGAAVRHE